MKKTIIVVIAMAFLPTCAFAVDGVVLINQSAVMAAGGYPYIISQPGSYKLSGDLTAPSNTNAINVTSRLVTLDLNGFNVSCSAAVGVVVNCITDTATISNLTILNGTILVDQDPFNLNHTIVAINIGSPSTSVHDVSIHAPAASTAMKLGAGSIVHHNNVTAQISVGGLSVIVENVTFGISTTPSSKLANNVP